jgi:adenylate cyclase
MTPDALPRIIVALLALGMALAFTAADRRAPTSRALALFLAWVGLAITLGTLIEEPLIARRGMPAWDGVFALPGMLAFVFAYEWVLRVRRTASARNLRTRAGDFLLRSAQALALLYGLLSLLYPGLRRDYFLNVSFSRVRLHPAAFAMFAAPLGISLVLGTVAVLLMRKRRPDKAESLRLISFLVGVPFMASAMVVAPAVAPVALALGLVIFLVGAVQYHVIQGQRAQFMARFLAPQVATLVREQGLRTATQEQTLEISVVCCDLRGFTAFSESTSSHTVIQILREYYDAVGAAAAAVGGTIKDQAGDGVLILVGAPIAFSDNARRALELAKRIRTDGIAVTGRWSGADLRLGVGVGVASGYVTVGVIGAASRLEYTAVGPAVNLAARLCSEAAHGEVLVDGRTTELLGADARERELKPGAALHLKGFHQPVPSYVLAAA